MAIGRTEHINCVIEEILDYEKFLEKSLNDSSENPEIVSRLNIAERFYYVERGDLMKDFIGSVKEIPLTGGRLVYYPSSFRKKGIGTIAIDLRIHKLLEDVRDTRPYVEELIEKYSTESSS